MPHVASSRHPAPWPRPDNLPVVVVDRRQKGALILLGHIRIPPPSLRPFAFLDPCRSRPVFLADKSNGESNRSLMVVYGLHAPACGRRRDRAPGGAQDRRPPVRYRCRLAMAFSSTPRWGTTSACSRASPRRTARVWMPQASSPLMRSSRVAPVTEHSPSRSLASRSNNPVNCDPGSAHGTRIYFTPWAAQSIPGPGPSIHVVN